MTSEQIDQAIEAAFRAVDGEHALMQSILERVADRGSVPLSQLVAGGHVRTAQVCRARTVAVYTMRCAGLSQAKVGRFLNITPETVRGHERKAREAGR